MRGDVNGGDDLRHHMARGDKVDVMATLILQAEHDIGQFLRGYFVAHALLADFPILAEHTAQVAPAKEDGTGTVAAAQRVFFTLVGAGAVHPGPLSGATYRTLRGLAAVDVTIVCTEVTVLQMLVGSANASGQFAVLQQVKVCWSEGRR